MSRRFPFPLPSGWFQVAWSEDLAAGEVKPLRYFGRDLVMFRAAEGTVHVLDAFCPHLGAHLGYGGKVEGEGIVCPFHAWKFDGAGACVNIPYASRIPRQARVAPWQVREIYGFILVWHSVDGTGPTWEVPEMPEYQNEEWTGFQHMEWTIKTANQEMAENAVDSAHFMYVHGASVQPRTTARMDGPHFHAESVTLMNTKFGDVEGMVYVDSWSFGWTYTRFTGIVETLLVSSVTAIEEGVVHVRFSFAVKKFGGRTMTGGIGKAFVEEIQRQLGQDIPIWENKVHLERPLLCDGDGPIGLFRTWARQFYPQGTSVEEESKERSVDDTDHLS